MPKLLPRSSPWLLLFALLASLPLHAGNGDRVHFGKSIDVADDERTGDLVCIGCSIRVEGTCEGDIVAIGGSIALEGDAQGDVVAVGGSIRLGENAVVARDVVTVGGRLWRHPNAVVRGTISTRSGVLIILALVVIPLLPVIVMVALIVWLINRNRRPVPIER